MAIARAYKGEKLSPGACTRRALTAEGLAERVPDWDALKEKVLAALPPMPPTVLLLNIQHPSFLSAPFLYNEEKYSKHYMDKDTAILRALRLS